MPSKASEKSKQALISSDREEAIDQQLIIDEQLSEADSSLAQLSVEQFFTILMPRINLIITQEVEKRLNSPPISDSSLISDSPSASDSFFAFDSPSAVEAASNFPQLRPKEVDYFDPEYEKEKNTHSAVINADKYVYYKDVYIFVNRLRDLTTQYDETIIKKVIVSVLRDSALM